MTEKANWRFSRIDERRVSIADYRGHRLYICERFGRVQSWVDGVKVGDYSDIVTAEQAAIKRAGCLPIAEAKG